MKLNEFVEKLVKEELIKEYEEEGLGGIYNDYYDSLGPGGYGGGGSHQSGMLKQTFIDPFLDVFQTAIYAIKNITIKGKHFLKQFLTGFKDLFIPFAETDYKTMRAIEEKELLSLQMRYKPFLQRNMDALRSSDFQLVSFLLDPSMLLGSGLLRAGLPFAEDFYNFVRGEYRDEGSKFKPLSRQEILQSQDVKQLQRFGTKATVDRVKDFSKITSIEDLENKMGTSFQSEIQKAGLTDPKDVEGVKQAIILKAKEEYKKYYIDQLQKNASVNPYAREAISKIKSFK